jgi:hypothetical protein
VAGLQDVVQVTPDSGNKLSLVVAKLLLRVIGLESEISAIKFSTLKSLSGVNEDLTGLYVDLDRVFNFLRQETSVLSMALTRLQKQPEDSACTACRCSSCVDLELSRFKILGEGMKIFKFSCSVNGSRVHLKPGAVQRKRGE